jgi:hypothetical protein
MARPKTKTNTGPGKNKRSRTPRSAPPRTMGRSMGRLLFRLALRPLRWFAYALAAAILWVGAYTIINPPGGYYLAAEWMRLAPARCWPPRMPISATIGVST